MRKPAASCLGALLLGLLLAAQGRAQNLSAATDGQRPPEADPATQTFAGPLRIFDNLYYLGTDFVSAWLLVTEDGLIMIDSLYQGFTGEALDAVASLGFDPADIEYVLITHGHTDHAGGAAEIKTLSGARVGMTLEDWTLSGQDADWTVEDGDILTLGDTVIRFYKTPGHTPGVLSMLFPVRDGDREYMAFLFGGHNVTSAREQDLVDFVASVERLQRDLPGEVAVNLTSHPWASLVFQRADLLERRGPGDPHPFVDAADFDAFLAERLENGRARLETIR